MQFNKKVAAVLAAGAVAVAGSGVAFAYWTTSGSGTGSATTSAGQTDNLTFTQTGATADMYPGDSAQFFTVDVKNTSTQAAYVTSVKAYLTVTQADGVTGTCDATDYELDGSTTESSTSPVTLAWTAQELAASGHASTAAATDSVKFHDKTTTNQDGCKGATVTINYVAS